MVMFSSATVFSCPVCNKTIAIQPKGEEFEVLKELDQLDNKSEENDKTEEKNANKEE
jgi:hypothetical protein